MYMPRLARDLMTVETLSIPADLPFLELQHLLVEAQTHGAPVVDEGGTVVGIVTAMDLLRVADQAWDDESDEGESDDPLDELRRLTARDIASPDVVWVTAETPIASVADVMRREGIHRVVVGTDGRMEGVLTAFDLLAECGGS